MTIKPGEEWGSDTARSPTATQANTDAELVAAIDAGLEVVVAGGDLWRTFGSPGSAAPARRYPIDLVEVSFTAGAGDDRDDRSLAAAHVVARRPWYRGGWLLGPVVVVMNAEFIGDWEVAPRGHPNDGRLETFELDAGLGIRQRLAIRRRLHSASHLPHPAITVRPARERSWTFASPLHVWVDGVHRGRAAQLTVVALPDAATVVV